MHMKTSYIVGGWMEERQQKGWADANSGFPFKDKGWIAAKDLYYTTMQQMIAAENESMLVLSVHSALKKSRKQMVRCAYN